jgi:hypothetical protein
LSANLTTRQQVAIGRISGLILANALIFQEVLAQRETSVWPLAKLRTDPDVINSLLGHWDYIIQQLTFSPIFRVARDLLQSMASDASVTSSVQSLVERAQQIVRWRGPLRHDLAGRIYHRLLSESKYLGAYYTSVPAATLLLKLTLRQNSLPIDWAEIDDLKKLKIADLACGTGTLLMAAADVVTDNYTRACAVQRRDLDLVALHQTLLNDVLHGYDVLQSAVHLTASTLMLRVPDNPIKLTHLYALPLGGEARRLGSLDFLIERTIHVPTSLYGPVPEMERVRITRGSDEGSPVALPDLDVCVMNPPFTRSVGGNLLFGSLPDAQRGPMQQKLRRIVRQQHVAANITAGLGSAFVACADRALKPGGRLALVLPRALLSGIAWGATRALLGQNYDLESLIVSHEPDRWNFSENTNMSEVLVVARKRVPGEAPQGNVVSSNLWRNPRNAVEALSLASSIIQGPVPDLETGSGARTLHTGTDTAGQAVQIPWPDLRTEVTWNFASAFAQSELLRVLWHLRKGNLCLPGDPIAALPLCPLGQLAILGFDVRDIADGFELADYKTSFPAFWNHEADRVRSLQQKRNAYLNPLLEPRPGRTVLRNADHLWTKAGRLLIAERLRLNTHRLATIWCPQRVLSNVWWTTTLRSEQKNDEKALALWLNSSLGILLLLTYREETEGAWGKFKKPLLEQMPVLDPDQLPDVTRDELASVFDTIGAEGLYPIAQIEHDPVRARIDDALAAALAIPDLSPLRSMLGAEPLLRGDLAGLMPP